MIKRTETRKIFVGDVQIGGQDKVVIQSMTNTKTKNIIIIAIALLSCLFIIGIVQSIILNVKHSSLNDLKATNVSLSQNKKTLEEDYETAGNYVLVENGEYSDKYKDDYKDHNVKVNKNSTDENADNETIIVEIKER